MHYLAQLLARPQQRFAAGELVAAVKGTAAAVDPERTRSAVSKRIRSTIKKVATYHPALGYHLDTAIKTGHSCTYHPDPQQVLHWQV